ncbi:cysteine protease StiP domain-containing protein [Psychrobacter sp. I-STPA10]|uniref:cysteine protease StiP domain-containing protein n=1 Tax=Psychrobacter sp. I-STPA10 TaxID=2585769 RepID=UPI001E5D2C92|nr:cysteine protease StiP domain-containing protein [Psychrobacter sp. I-STPA10]
MNPSQTTTPSTLSTHCGSYLPDDVTLLLNIVDKDSIANVPVQQKEALIQSGEQHYSDMLTLEQAPSDTHQQLYAQALKQGSERMASDIANLATTLHYNFIDKIDADNPLVLVSLVRAGLPIGVLLQRAFRMDTDNETDDLANTDNPDSPNNPNNQDSQASYALPSVHYGISIIRDRGLDHVAMQQIFSRHPNSPIVFVDGWTGKGAIYEELAHSLVRYQDTTHPYHENIFHQDFYHCGFQRPHDEYVDVVPLITLADPAGVAWLSASNDDWLIPSGLLGSTVSGLISRTLYTEPSSNSLNLNNESTNELPQGLHRSVLYHELAAHDCSLQFIETIDNKRKNLKEYTEILPTYGKPRYRTQAVIEQIAKQYQISNYNRIKPTIAEATRAILRRDPERVLLASADHPDTILLRHLCSQRNIHIDIIGEQILPYQAITLIKKRNAK